MSQTERFNRDHQRFAEWARIARESGETPAIPAATVVILRDTDHGIETIMLRKNSKLAFGGMWVFPGGRIDEEDRIGLDPGDDAAAGRVAAVREAREEADLAVDADDLVLFSHWIPPAIAPKRFATWFYAVAGDDAEVVIDDGEIVDSEWMTITDAMARHDAGEIELVPPTWVTLHTLGRYADVEGALRALDERPARRYATRIGTTTDGPVAMWEGDAATTESDPDRPGPRHRLEMFESGYTFIDTTHPDTGHGD